MMQKKILIVDDQRINRTILKKLLQDEYEVLEAADGEAALLILREQGPSISAVLLDLVMPVMDGYTVLEFMEKDALLAAIPVLVASQADKNESEARALKLGALDFVAKPYNPEILRKRLANLIELSESNACINCIERDALTGLYNEEAFCRYATQQLTQHPERAFTLVVTDVERFKLVNDNFGNDEGDKLLRYIADKLKENTRQYSGLCARLSADHFAVLLNGEIHYDEFRAVAEEADQSLATYPLSMRISLKFGVYPVLKRDIPISLMCDRAMLAAGSVKGQYHSVYAYYDDAIRMKMLKEQEITNVMKEALTEGQFQVYFQPKYDLLSERVAGAEALVRWIHPTLGFMNPGEFIPLFERNGFITELDRFVWDETCELIAQWIKRNGKYVPVSVNVSRRDIYQVNLPDILSGIVKKHGLRPEQLHLEITETAYTENPKQLIKVIGTLKQLGFVIEMDDFGSGYSSLNMLSELPIDILKLDMRFIQIETEKNSSRSILSFIISLAKWMNLLVVAEGVETKEQIDLLRNMDCNYVQGYYYDKPMPASEFAETLLNAELADPITAEEKDWQTGTLEIGESSAKKVMLIVDDIAVNRAILAECFQRMYTIVQADNGQIAYEYIETHFDEIAVIMLDLIMPVMDGFQLLKKICVNPLLNTIPIVVTSESGEASEAHAFELGASDFLSKPYNMDVAIHRVQNVTARNTIATLEREKRMLSKMKQLTMEAKLDQLTGLYNRTEMERQVEAFFTGEGEKDGVFFMLDIDNFKNINDLYGHSRGDEAICTVAKKLQDLFREDDIICRMGGDEFAVFMKAKLNAGQIPARLQRMCQRLNFIIQKTNITCSIGVCIAPEFGGSYQEVYHNADLALLTAKRMGKNCWRIYGGESELPEQVLYRNMDWLLDESSDAIVVCDAQTYEIYYLNDIACALAGKKKTQCVGKPCYKALWNLDGPCNHCVHIDRLTRDYCEYEARLDDSGRSFLIKGKLIDWGNRKARIQYVQDDTSRATLVRQVTELSENRKLLLDLLPGGVFRYHAKTQQFNFISENMLQMLGYTKEQFMCKFENRFDLMVWHKDRERVLAEINGQISRSDYGTCTYRIEKVDGSVCWIYDVRHIHPDESGGEIYVIVSDITAQRQAELKNEQLLERLQTVVDNVPGALCMYMWNGKAMKALQISHQFAEIFGQDIALSYEQANNLMTDAVHPDDLDGLRQSMHKVLFEYLPMDRTFRVFHHAKQRYIWLRMQASAKPSSDGSALIFAIYSDISEEYERSSKLQQQAQDAFENYQILVNTVQGGIGIYELVGDRVVTTYYSDGFCALSGFSREELHGLCQNDALRLTVDEDQSALLRAIKNSVKNKTNLQIIYRIKTKNGSPRYVNLNATYIADPNGRNPKFHAVFMDADETVRLTQVAQEQQLRYEVAIKSSGINIWEYDIQQDILTVISNSPRINQNSYIIENYSVSTLDNQYVREDSIPDFLDIFEKLKRGEKEVTADLWYRTNDGHGWWSERVTYTTVFDAVGKPIKAFGAGRDVTREKLAEQKFQEEMNYRTAIQGDNLGSVKINLTQNKILDGDSPFEMISQWLERGNADYYFKQNAARIPNREKRADYLKRFSRQALMGSYNSGDYLVTADFSRYIDDINIRWLQYNVHLMKHPESNDIIAFIAAHDITDEQVMKMMMETVTRTDYEFFIIVDGKRNSASDYSSTHTEPLFLPGQPFDKRCEELICKTVCPEDLDRVRENCKITNIFARIQNGDIYKFNYGVQEPNGKIRRKQLQFTQMYAEQAIFLLTRIDVTEVYMQQEQSQQLLREALDSAQNAANAKTDFLSRMSHDIRTPLNAVIGLSGLGVESNSMEEMRNYYKQIQASGQYLLSIINDVLDMRKIESNSMVLHPTVVFLPKFIQETIAIVKPTIVSKGLHFEVKQQGITSQYMRLDVTHVRQVAVNLLSNAIKFTPNGGHVELCLENVSRNGSVVRNRLIVRDDGEGISEAFLPKVFSPFEQENVDDDVTRKGTGLGLPIVKSIVEAMGGTIQVESKKGIGTAFIVEWNLEVASEEDLPLKGIEKPVDRSVLNGCHILLCEDHPLNAQIVIKLLEKQGVCVEHAANGKLALERFRTAQVHEFDAILMDIRMPVMDGLEATETIRSMNRAEAKSIPIIAMTANAFDEDVQRSLDAGMNAHLAKPIEPQRLYDTLAAFIMKEGN
ncbi:response regulator [Eubacterium barkeri]|uniref:Stage 0 sporulation protein A homolog n=1 Tax=Eubacterium barkeri TaxID=1528 RepID=A0A1H3AP38_EUBBA|nr:EAL domain-containing protein [Eubacterium barkeri]SDX30609.1 PAS domain S-box-containing protein/diguanylate cyclase (GGDEF) domain-containing protein [Eubacterium barkeri]